MEENEVMADEWGGRQQCANMYTSQQWGGSACVPKFCGVSPANKSTKTKRSLTAESRIKTPFDSENIKGTHTKNKTEKDSKIPA